MNFPGGSDGKESACNARDGEFDPWVGMIHWRREWLLTPVFLTGEFHRQRSVVGYNPWGLKQRDGHNWVTHTHTHTHTHIKVYLYTALIHFHYSADNR